MSHLGDTLMILGLIFGVTGGIWMLILGSRGGGCSFVLAYLFFPLTHWYLIKELWPDTRWILVLDILCIVALVLGALVRH